MGVSNRKVEKITKKMGIEKMDKSKVSRLCKALDVCDLAAYMRKISVSANGPIFG